MSDIQVFFDATQEMKTYAEKSRILAFLLHSFEQMAKSKRKIPTEDLTAVTGFIFGEMEILADLIPKAATYKERDEYFEYGDALVGMCKVAKENNIPISDEQLMTTQKLIALAMNMRVLENAIDEAFERDSVTKADIDIILSIVKTVPEEYYRGKLYVALIHYQSLFNKVAPDAKRELAAYVCGEFERLLGKGAELTEDGINALEVAVDACKFFITPELTALLKKIFLLPHNNIRYFVLETLLAQKESADAAVIKEMAGDLVYAEMTFTLLKRHGLANLFPAEYTAPEYLAKSDMVHWLSYPTELGKAPDKIELIGCVKVKGEEYYIFKYMSDSDTLSDDCKNIWLIGWSSDDGGTFSNFDKLSEYEKGSTEKTLKVIKKKLL